MSADSGYRKVTQSNSTIFPLDPYLKQSSETLFLYTPDKQKYEILVVNLARYFTITPLFDFSGADLSIINLARLVDLLFITRDKLKFEIGVSKNILSYFALCNTSPNSAILLGDTKSAEEKTLETLSNDLNELVAVTSSMKEPFNIKARKQAIKTCMSDLKAIASEHKLCPTCLQLCTFLMLKTATLMSHHICLNPEFADRLCRTKYRMFRRSPGFDDIRASLLLCTNFPPKINTLASSLFHTLVHRNLQALMVHHNFDEVYEKKSIELRDNIRVNFLRKTNIVYYVSSDKGIYDLLCEELGWDSDDVVSWVVIYMYLAETLELSGISVLNVLCYLFPQQTKTFLSDMSYQIVIFTLEKQIFPQ